MICYDVENAKFSLLVNAICKDNMFVNILKMVKFVVDCEYISALRVNTLSCDQSIGCLHRAPSSGAPWYWNGPFRFEILTLSSFVSIMRYLDNYYFRTMKSYL